MRKSGKRGRRIKVKMHRAREDLNLDVTVHRASATSEVPVWERARPQIKAVNMPKAKPWDEVLAARIIEEQPEETNYRPLAQRYAPTVGKNVETFRPKLRDALEYVDGRWTRRRSEPA